MFMKSPGTVAERLDHLVDVELLGPDVEQSGVGVEVDRRDDGDEVLDLVGCRAA